MATDISTGTSTSTSTSTASYGRDLFTAAAAAAECAPQLADEIRGHTRHLAGRVSAGGRLHPRDVDVRTLVGLLGQAGVAVPPVRVDAG